MPSALAWARATMKSQGHCVSQPCLLYVQRRYEEWSGAERAMQSQICGGMSANHQSLITARVLI
jgi:hypothetical protein